MRRNDQRQLLVLEVAGADVLGESLRRAEGLKSLESADIRANYVMTPPAGFF